MDLKKLKSKNNKKNISNNKKGKKWLTPSFTLLYIVENKSLKG